MNANYEKEKNLSKRELSYKRLWHPRTEKERAVLISVIKVLEYKFTINELVQLSKDNVQVLLNKIDSGELSYQDIYDMNSEELFIFMTGAEKEDGNEEGSQGTESG